MGGQFWAVFVCFWAVFSDFLLILAIFLVFLMCQAVSMLRLLSQVLKTLSFGIELQLCYRTTVTWIQTFAHKYTILIFVCSYRLRQLAIDL